MHKKPGDTPMVRIQERAPEEKWMKYVSQPAGPVGQHGIVDATNLDPNVVNPPRPQLPPKGVGQPGFSSKVEDSRIPVLEAERDSLQTQRAQAQKEIADLKEENEAMGSQLHRLRGDLEQEQATVEALRERLNAVKAELEEAQQQISELESAASESNGVETVPPKVVISEITNTKRKGSAFVLRGNTQVGETVQSIVIRLPYDELTSSLKDK